MARSVKKNPICTDGRDGRKWPKRQANKKVRRFKEDLADGNAYKKLYETWDIHDYVSRYTWEEWLEWKKEEIESGETTIEKEKKMWAKYYKRK